MTKRKTEPKEPPVKAEDLGKLAMCPACQGYGGVPHGDLWKTCQRCGGGGRVEAKPVDAPEQVGAEA